MNNPKVVESFFSQNFVGSDMIQAKIETKFVNQK